MTAGTASSTSSLGDSIEVPAALKVEKGAKKGKHIDKVFPRTSLRESADLSRAEPITIVLQDADVGEIDRREHGKKAIWKNQHLPFNNFVRDLPVWQQKLIPSLLDWGMSNIAEPFGTTNHADFKPMIKKLWTTLFAHLSEKDGNGDTCAEHPAVYSVVSSFTIPS